MLYTKKQILTNDEMAVLSESYLCKVRIEGLKFWKAYPLDKRRNDWFLWTVINRPNYFNKVDQQFDIPAKTEWANIFPELKANYLYAMQQLPDKDQSFRNKAWFEVSELNSDLRQQKFIYQITGIKNDLTGYALRIIELAKQDRGTDFFQPLQMCGDIIITNAKYMGYTNDEIFVFLKQLMDANIGQLTEWADAKSDLLHLKESPLALSFKTFDNKWIDINQLKGKVILIDFWATWCSNCLEYMPVIQKAYKAYHEKGFEVLSLSINKISEREKVLTAERRLNVTWPLGIIGDEKLKTDIWRKFKFSSVPQLILLDKNGMLIENNGGLMNETALNNLIKQALDIP